MVLTMISRRIGLSGLTLFSVSILLTIMIAILPGDVAEQILGQLATPESVAALRTELGLDRPLVARYVGWLLNFVQGDFGTSLANKLEVSDLVGARIGNTFFLAAYAAAIAVPAAIFLGVVTAIYRNTALDRGINIGALSAISMPEFFIAYAFILIFSVKLGLFPSLSNVTPETGFGERLLRTTLPALTLTLGVTAHMMRMTRTVIISVLASPYIEMARLKGASPRKIVLFHALPNVFAPIANVVALNLAYLVVGVVVVEVVFVYPGLGQLLVDSVSKRDFPVVQASALIFAGVYVLLNLVADVISFIGNPRILHPR